MEQINAEILEFLEKDEYVDYPLVNLNFSSLIGQQFHHLMQQLMMGLPVEPLLLAYPEMAHWVQQLYPIISIPAMKQSNIHKGKLIGEWYLVAHFDLLIEMPEKVIAVDWTNKTNIPMSVNLENSWHTQLRLFLLVETYSIPAENISLMYCFVNADEYPTIYQFNYSSEKHSCFIERLAIALSKLPTASNSDDLNGSASDDEHLLNLQKFFKGEINTTEYLATVPEVEI